MNFELSDKELDVVMQALQLVNAPWAVINPIIQKLLAQANNVPQPEQES